MSIKAIAWVWEHSRSQGYARLALLAVADCANSSGGNAYPSLAELCHKTRMSRRGMQSALSELESLGELAVIRGGGRGRTNRYRINMDSVHAVPGSKPSKGARRAPKAAPERVHETSERVHDTSKRVHSVHPEPSEPSEPSTKSSARARPRPTPPPSPPSPPQHDGLHEIPDDFNATDAMRRWAVATYGTAIDVEFETQQFVSYYRSTGARRKSWPDAWQKWIRDSAQRRPRDGVSNGRTAPTRRPGPDERAAAVQALKNQPGARHLNVIPGELA